MDHLPTGFFSDFWEKQIYISTGAIIRDFGHETPRSIIRRYAESVKVFAPGQGQEKFWVSPDAALQFLEKGCTLYLIDYQKYDRRCKELLDSFSPAIGPALGRVSIFISNARSYMPFHWDILNNFTYQLSGQKTWLLAPNDWLKYPVGNFAAGRSQFPEQKKIKPDRRRVTKIVMEPGSLLYVPRGHWHATRTHLPSLSLSVNFEPTYVADLIITKLRKKLLDLEVFRRNIQGEDPQKLEKWALSAAHNALVAIQNDKLDY